ncbi:MAG: cytochrome c, partial [Verrucomicrobiota bacterium]
PIFKPPILKAILVLLAGSLPLFANDQGKAGSSYITYSNLPSGTIDEPLVFRTYLPNPGLDSEVTSRHGQGATTPKYSPKNGLFSSNSIYEPIQGIPAGFAVNHGDRLSYVWDTTECRLLYAWTNGFLDMESYWGPPERGNRKSFDYVPRLVGQLFYKAKGQHPLRINGKPLPAEIQYKGNRRIAGRPEFEFEALDRVLTVRVLPADSLQTIALEFVSSETTDQLDYVDPSTAFEVRKNESGRLRVLLRPNASEVHTGFKKEVLQIAEASSAIGAKLYQNFGCMACHSIDGGRNHGPTFQGLADSERTFPAIGSLLADEDYLRESIVNPAAKSVPGYPVGMMPAYPLGDKQVDSLILYIQSLK